MRRILGGLGDDSSSAALRRSSGGYELVIDPDRVDVHRARRLADRARSLAADQDGDSQAVELLREACLLWRGSPLAGLGSDWAVRARAGLEQEWLALTIERYTVELRRGEHAAAVGPLAVLLAEHPLVEPLASLLMLALYRSGRQADALAVYGRTRQSLVGELGDEPGVDLQRLHQQILRRDPALELTSKPVALARPSTSPASIPPAQLPPDVAHFTGREEQLRLLDELRRGLGGQQAPVLVGVIDGMAGVGKSALAVHWASRTRGEFPDGQLYVNLRGYETDPPLPVIDALGRFLRAFGVPAERVPVEPDEASATYRSLLAKKRVIVVLDNAASADQVRPLLPSGPGSVVVVTSRDQLDGLVARDGAHRVGLQVLSPEEARALLLRTIGRDRSETDIEAVDELAALCGYLPLALRIAAASLATRRSVHIGAFVNQLRATDPVTALAVPDDPHSAVAAAFDLSYARLPDAARRIFRLIALAPGPDISAGSAAALADVTTDQAAQKLDKLVRAHLVTEHQHGRYAFHSLLRTYAVERAKREDTEPDRDAALGRLYDFYLRAIDAAARLLYPEKLRLHSAPSQPSVEEIRDHASALAWLDGEMPSLITAVENAASGRSPRVAWLLADGLRGYFWLRRSIVDWLSITTTALAAARASGESKGEAAARLSLADAYLVGGRYPQAIAHYRRALRHGQELGLHYVQSASLNNLGAVYQFAGRPRDAAAYFRQALELSRKNGNEFGAGVHLGNVGSAQRAMGLLQEAINNHTKSLAIYRRIGSPAAEATSLRELGETYHAMGRLSVALDHLTQALSLHQRVGDRPGQAATQRCICAVYRDCGRPSLAMAAAALGLAREVGLRHLEADALNTLATVHQHLTDHHQALNHHQQALRIATNIELGPARAEALIGKATAHQHLGDHKEAHRCLEDAAHLTSEAGLRLLEGQALTALAALHLADGDPDRADTLGKRALMIHCATGHRLGEAHTHAVLSQIRRCVGDTADAHNHAKHAHTLLTAIGAPAPPRLAALLTSDAPAP